MCIPDQSRNRPVVTIPPNLPPPSSPSSRTPKRDPVGSRPRLLPTGDPRTVTVRDTVGGLGRLVRAFALRAIHVLDRKRRATEGGLLCSLEVRRCKHGAMLVAKRCFKVIVLGGIPHQWRVFSGWSRIQVDDVACAEIPSFASQTRSN